MPSGASARHRGDATHRRQPAAGDRRARDPNSAANRCATRSRTVHHRKPNTPCAASTTATAQTPQALSFSTTAAAPVRPAPATARAADNHRWLLASCATARSAGLQSAGSASSGSAPVLRAGATSFDRRARTAANGLRGEPPSLGRPPGEPPDRWEDDPVRQREERHLRPVPPFPAEQPVQRLLGATDEEPASHADGEQHGPRSPDHVVIIGTTSPARHRWAPGRRGSRCGTGGSARRIGA